ncbi:Wzz/FepE/Etk N-terminal domain-containing protein [Corynebacterium phoceense]|uniref:Wzz/FepE/Etk N-terminal domain-containing protein n=1 Tax=Corynebacterium phoceense TaxID=1686286 RepID=UPI00211CF12C|nr:Wzz/FepE/Etk N-terminal domain-containing protein [Corynebacterium phoceense]MCQ9341946.1 Wzz/FepE/Etk N-terminal domain-containing protein [Corynebacterium phoceense]MCQ9344907.1 Wzz/FepE/Etk N-terminal domain-containing protein [Corynebacterium phoceense]
MNDTRTAPSDAVGFDFLWAALTQRARWIAAGIVVGLIAAAVYLVVTPRNYVASTQVNVAAVSADPLVGDKAPSMLVDFSTELQIARSAEVAHAAQDSLGDGWTTEELQGVEASGDAEGTVVTLTYSHPDRDRAVAGADALATAYLDQRVELTRTRFEDTLTALDEAIKNYQTDYAASISSKQRQLLSQRLSSLRERRTQLAYASFDAGTVLSFAEDNPVYRSPSTLKYLLVGALGGLVLGVVLSLLAYAWMRRPRSTADLERVFHAPVFIGVGPAGDAQRWDLAAAQAAHATRAAQGVTVLRDGDDAETVAAADAVTHATGAQMLAADTHRAERLAAVQQGTDVLLVGPVRWTTTQCAELQRDLASVGVTLRGIITTAAKH